MKSYIVGKYFMIQGSWEVNCYFDLQEWGGPSSFWKPEQVDGRGPSHAERPKSPSAGFSFGEVEPRAAGEPGRCFCPGCGLWQGPRWRRISQRFAGPAAERLEVQEAKTVVRCWGGRGPRSKDPGMAVLATWSRTLARICLGFLLRAKPGSPTFQLTLEPHQQDVCISFLSFCNRLSQLSALTRHKRVILWFWRLEVQSGFYMFKSRAGSFWRSQKESISWTFHLAGPPAFTVPNL